ncbi:MAG: alpha/beta hydrolase [Phenylobacterium sp.]
MPTFESGGVTLAYDDIVPQGHQGTILLLHGFASNRNEGWRRTGWYGAFERRRIRCIGLDQRCHGESAKLYDPQACTRDRLAADALALLDHLDVKFAHVFGYSMGTGTAMQLALDAPDRVDKLILGGIGERLFEPRRAQPEERGMSLSEAMLAEDPASIEGDFARSFRHFADEQGEDRQALAAFLQAPNGPLDRDGLGKLPMEVLVVAGDADKGAGDPAGLARHFPYGKSRTIPGCDHFSAIPHALTKAAVFDFLDGMLDEP